MYNYRILEQVTRKPKAASKLLKKVMIVFAVLFVLMGIAISQGFMLPGFLLVLLYFVYDVFSQKDYEYILEDNILTIDVILGKRYRRTEHILDMRELEVVAPNQHPSVAKYRKNGGTEKLKKYDYTSYDENVPYYTMIVLEDREKIKLLLDLNEEMLQMLKKSYPDKVFV
ncbi:MAG: hypothetical protein MR224_11060 [Dorea sp.]|nr:hypothetical protein [Dorea sp.]MDY2814839.1 hypothetical protein [Dorea sp.]